MSGSTYITVKKGLGTRTAELIQSLLIIRDCLKDIRQGKTHQIIPVYGQIRSLLSEKSKSNKPLLIDIATILAFPLEFYCMEEAGNLPASLKSIEDKMFFQFKGFPLSLERELPSQNLTTLESFLNHNVISFKKRGYSVDDIIKFFANKSGGSHYSTDLPEDFAQMMSIGINNQPVLVNALVQIAEITMKLGVKLLKKQSDFEIHLSLFLPEQKLNKPGFIFDYKYVDSPMRISFLLQQNLKPVLSITGVDSQSASAVVNQVIDWTKPSHFSLTAELQDDMTTRLGISKDGIMVAETMTPYPIFVDPQIVNYHQYQNKSADSDDPQLSIAIGELLVVGGKIPIIDRGRLHQYFIDQLSAPNQPCVYFSPTDYGYAEPGTSNLRMSGFPTKWSFEKLINGEFPIRPDDKHD